MAPSKQNVFQELVLTSPLTLHEKALFTAWASEANKQLPAHSNQATFSLLLSQIPTCSNSGILPLASLAFALSYYRGKTPAFDTIRYQTKLWTGLPESIKAGQDERATSILLQISNYIGSSVGDIPSLLHYTSQLPALVDPTSQKSLSHQDLASFIQSFKLPLPFNNNDSKPVVAIALPNGLLLGLAAVAVSSYYTAAPINTSGGAVQFQNDIDLAQPCCILVLESDIGKLGLTESWVERAGIQLLLVQPNEDLTFRVKPLDGCSPLEMFSRIPNSADDLALILFTSGTSGTKKVVPITCFSLLTGVSCVIDSWGLTQEDSCLNMMPLNHVGGLVRNLFAPLLSGGSTILCPAFDPNLFWDILEDGHGTWYYASPSMHMSILAEGDMRGDSVSRRNLRLVCNAAGGLLPALAARLNTTFSCTVLPSYGMTECMPISTPPLTYTLDRVGTSGIGCGPEIAILDESGRHLPPGQVGQINVRGGPVFPGYLKDGKIDRSAFGANGWFDTGDLGLLDRDGYLYLTGRGKEVINRGGEIISPFEVEEAVTIASQDTESSLFGRVQQVMAFSAPHDVLQEVVGIVLVTPPRQPRPDVRDVHAALKPLLHSPKWPVVIVYMDALPTSNNKLVRIRFSERIDMAPTTNETKLIERHFEGVCPPVNSSLRTKIAASPCESDLALVLAQVEKHINQDLEAHMGESHHDGTPIVYLAPREQTPDFTKSEPFTETLYNKLQMMLDGFLLPSQITLLTEPFPRDTSNSIDTVRLEIMLKALKASDSTPASSETEQHVRRAFSEVLSFDITEITSSSDFFQLGGDSMSAGQLLSILRRDLKVRIPVDQLFVSSKVNELWTVINKILLANNQTDSSKPQERAGCTETYSSTNPLVMLVQLLPIVVIYPMKSGLQWTSLMYTLSTIAAYWDEPNIPSRFLALVGAMFISRAVTQIIVPICGITLKWLIIGQYREGMYPMWGPYHTRWWIVEKILQICGKGVFRHLDFTRILYYRLLGAKIGKGVVIERGTILGEFDLLKIGDNTRLDRCICRPFAAETNTSMYLGKISIGRNASIGLKTHVAAGSTIPDDTFIGANSSSYEMDDDNSLSSGRPATPHILMQLFCIIPIKVSVLFISSIPWMAGLFGIVMGQTAAETDSVKTIITWWATPHRIIYHYLAQTFNVSIRPFVWFALVFLIKTILNKVCGIARPMPAEDRSGKDNFRTHLMAAIVPHGSLKSITNLFGTHYEFTSVAIRAMGGKVGRRVYWPGTGPSIEDFDLIDIGDDVVFGSRSHLITSDAMGSNLVCIGNGAMIADRVVLSPGVIVGPRAVLGSGAFIKRDQICDPESVWVGNRNGSALCLSSATTSNSTSMRKLNVELEKNSFSTDTPSHPDSTDDSPTSSKPPSYPNSMKSPVPGNPEFLQVTEKRLSDMSSKSGNSSATASIHEETSSSPFGRAFYQGQATYHVLGQPMIFFYSTFITIFVQLYWNVGTISTIILSRIMDETEQLHSCWYRPLKIYAFDVAILSAMYVLLSLLSLCIVVVAKWALLGRRKVGSYDWDKSSYCQRWQLFLTVEAIRRRCFGGNGVLGMLTGTHFLVLYFRALGAKIGSDCALFAGGRPSLMFTEPDLLELGDRVATDDASL
ncbi:putative peroxisomal-coenzyme A synthetase, partial [Lachnellula suecica]